MTTLTNLKLHQLTIENFMRIDALTVDVHGRHICISGPNGAGKTSAIDAIWAALVGLSSKTTPMPIKAGADKAIVRLDLGEIIVERRWTKTKTTLTVTAKDGSKMARPQQLLDGLFSVSALDPVAFQSLSPAEQIREILRVVGIKPPVDQVKEIVGEAIIPLKDESAATYLEGLTAEGSGALYLRRREIGRVLDQKQAAAKEAERLVESLGGAPSATEEPVTLSSLIERLQEQQAEAETRAKAKNEIDDLEREAARSRSLLESLEALAEESRRLIKEQQEELADTEQRIAKGKACVAGETQRLESKRQALGRVPDPAPAIADLKQQIANIEQTKAAQAKRAGAIEQFDRLKGELERVQAEHQRAGEALDRVRALRANLLDGVNLGVEGLEIADGELSLNGVPFRQASMSQKLRVGAAVAMLQKPALRLLRIDEGERLDDESQKLLLQLADAQGFEVIMTRVASGDGLKVEIVEGGSE